MQKPHTAISVGDRVRVRKRTWSVLASRHYEDCAVVTLGALEPSDAGRTQRVIWPFESITRLTIDRSATVVSVKAWRARCRAFLASQGSPIALRTAQAARMDVLAHQLEPALAIALGRSCRVLIADEVGLGKTIQASLVIAELIGRGAVDRCLVLAPAHLRDQWMDELSGRFALAPTLMDTQRVARCASELSLGTNPWSTVSLAVSSIDYVKRPEILPAVAGCRWDLVVVDEAHVATVGSDREAALGQLCRQAAYVVLVTATPHSGDRRAFLSLCALGRLAPGRDDLLVFRRSRAEVALGSRRRVHRVMVRPTPAEEKVYAALAELTEALATERGTVDGSRWLAVGVLHKRAQSSAYSLEQSIIRRLDTLAPAEDEASLLSEQLRLPLMDPTGDLDPADEAPVVGPILTDQGAEHRLLTQLLLAARQVQGRETKVLRLKRLLRVLNARHEPAIVFTEYRDTLLHLRRLLDVDCAILHGGLARDARRAALASFLDGAVPMLLATDAAGEGLNLQRSCRVVINLELPWNPMRLEQRIGRVDRIGQRRTVHAFHLIAGATREASMLDALAVRIASAQADIGAADPLGSRVSTVSSAEADASTLVTVRLRDEARAESQRIATYRTLYARGTRPRAAEPSEGRPTLSFARRRNACRLSISPSEVLLLVQIAFSDAHGQFLAARLTPARTVLNGGKRHLQECLKILAEWSPRMFDPAVDEWAQRCAREHRDFWSARLARERLVVASATTSVPLQPGLFDRRAERERELRRDQRHSLQSISERWMRVAKRALEADRVVVRAIAALTARR